MFWLSGVVGPRWLTGQVQEQALLEPAKRRVKGDEVYGRTLPQGQGPGGQNVQWELTQGGCVSDINYNDGS
jgi:hypothetical protein